MRRARKTRHWKSSKLIKARTLRVNYTLSHRTLRKAQFKNRVSSQGLLKIGGYTMHQFFKFLKPSLTFSYFSVNSVAVNIFPTLALPKSTDSTPKYFLSTPSVVPVCGYKAKALLPFHSRYYAPGLHLMLMFNSIKALPSRNSLEYKSIIYDHNYFLTSSMSKLLEPIDLSLVYKKLDIDKSLKKKRLMSLYFFV